MPRSGFDEFRCSRSWDLPPSFWGLTNEVKNRLAGIGTATIRLQSNSSRRAVLVVDPIYRPTLPLKKDGADRS